MRNIQVTKVTGRIAEEWVFNGEYFLPNLVLVGYTKAEIPAGKRKPVIVERFVHNDQRTSNVPCPELTDEIKAEAMAEFVSMLKVVTWKEYKK